ncbi:MAG: cation-efflux pump [Elusimicrobiota bacterium]
MWESVSRLFFKEAHVSVNFWSFAVIVFSIAVDYSRSRALMAVAKRHQSQALEADALHFSTDIWSSAVVLVGLFGVLAAGRLGLPWLAKADAVAALGVAAIVVGVCWKLAKRSIDDLLDTASGDLRDKVEAASRVPGVTEVRQVRARKSGPSVFVDVIVGVARDAGVEAAHAVSDKVEAAVQAAIPGADVVVHVEPSSDTTDPLTTARALAARHGLGAHSIRVREEPRGRTIELHLEVRGDATLASAHDLVTRFESELRAALPRVAAIVSHIEPCAEHPCAAAEDPAGERRVRAALLSFQGKEKTAFNAHELSVRSSEGQLSLTLHCSLDSAVSIQEAHDLTVRIERHLRTAVPELGRVVIHAEPLGSDLEI